MKQIAITGASGLIGRALANKAEACAVRVLRFVRREPRSPDEVLWQPTQDVALTPADLTRVAECDAVVHLAGENVASGYWTERRKRSIRESRVQGTLALCRALAQRSSPGLLVSASAVGYYGNRGDEILTEASPPGTGLFAQLCAEWERAADPAREAGWRVVHPRIGLVLAERGGALAKMVTPFRFGLGAILGNGRQYIPWISMEDAIAALWWMLEQQVSGVYNVVGPAPVANADFSRTLGQVLRRPVWLRAPAFALRAMTGDMADQALLASQRVIPERLASVGFHFSDTDLDSVLRRYVG
jgi:uncharacterized protein